jgi:hypothetical protein
LWEQSLDIATFPVTGRESVHSEGMSQVVQPRYETTFIFAAYASSAA